jgi:phosphoenolpyruvate carboxylase
MQIQLLRRWRAAGSPGDKGRALDDPDRVVLQALVAAVNGIAQGLQGTG